MGHVIYNPYLAGIQTAAANAQYATLFDLVETPPIPTVPHE